MQINSLEQLIKTFSKLPGLGPKSAKRIVLHLIQNKDNMLRFSQLLENAFTEIQTCNICFNIDISNPCEICLSNKRDKTILCIVENISDLWAIEKSKIYQGIYHVLGGSLSAIEGVSPKNLNFDNFKTRFNNSQVKEVIIATNSTLEGQTTAHYIAERLSKFNIKTTRLAHGVPIGGELDFLDDGTIAQALKARNEL